MKMLIEYAYRRETECPAVAENVLSLCEAAHYVQFDELFQLCSDWLRLHVDTSDCVIVGIVADRHDNSDLLRVADRVAAVNIALLAEREEFLSLSVDHLRRILAQDELGVTSEDDVLMILRKWMNHDEASRRAQVKTLSKVVRFPLLNYQETSDVLSDLDLVSHYDHSSGKSCRHRIGCDGVLLISGGMFYKDVLSDNKVVTQGYVVDGEASIYNASNDTWTAFPSLAQETCCHRVVTSYDNLYALGGYSSCELESVSGTDITETVQRYDAVRRQWVDDVAPMSWPRLKYEIVCCDNRIYGMSIGNRKAMCEVFDPQKETWIPVSLPMGSFGRSFIIFSLAKKVFAMGYSDNGLGYMKYDALEDRWCEFKPCPLPGMHYLALSCGYVTTEDRLYVHSSFSTTAVVFNCCSERFSVVENFFEKKVCRGLAYDHCSKRMYFVQVDERANKWDHKSSKKYGFREDIECAIVDRSLTLNFV